MYVHFYSYVGGIGKRNIIQGWPQVKHMGPYLKNKAKRAGVVDQVAEHLPRKCET
jgi:hypothetical protein